MLSKYIALSNRSGYCDSKCNYKVLHFLSSTLHAIREDPLQMFKIIILYYYNLLYNIKYSVEVYIGPGDDKRRAVRVYNVY